MLLSSAVPNAIVVQQLGFNLKTLLYPHGSRAHGRDNRNHGPRSPDTGFLLRNLFRATTVGIYRKYGVLVTAFNSSTRIQDIGAKASKKSHEPRCSTLQRCEAYEETYQVLGLLMGV